MPDSVRIVPNGRLLAITPQALGVEYAIHVAPAVPFCLCCDGRLAVVDVSGPLEYAPGLRDTYSQVRQRVQLALASSAQAVVLRVSSPGGEVWGAFDAARALRQDAAAARKPLIGFTESQACSAAYALLSGCGPIVAAESATLGSIGIIAALAETSKAEAAAGISWAIITSGERKADGNPHLPFSDAAIAALQSHVDQSALLFFQLINQHRGISVDQVQALQGNSLLATPALQAGLIDQVASWDQLQALFASGALLQPLGATMALQAQALTKDSPIMADSDKKDEKDKDEESAGASLAELQAEAESDDPDKRARARKALRAYYSDEDKAEDPEDKKEATKVVASAVTPELVALSQQVSALTAELSGFKKAEQDRKAAEAAAAVATLKASRPDMAATFAALPNLGIAEVTALISATPVPAGLYVDPAAHAIRTNPVATALDPEAKRLMDRAFGTEAAQPRIERRGNVTIFRAVPKAAAAGK